MESTRFRIESGSIDFTVPEKSTSASKSHQTNDEELFNSDGIIIKTDGRSSESVPFRFVIEKALFDMGNINPNNPEKVSATLSISGGRTSYQILVSESDMLHKLSGESIPDTACSGNSGCTANYAAPWKSVSAYGFGYNLEGKYIPDDFVNNNYFRPFPNSKKNMPPAVLMKATNKTDEHHSVITVKTVVSAVQADGSYETTLNFLAIPGF